MDADASLDKETARTIVHGMPSAEWKARQPAATAEQLARMEASLTPEGALWARLASAHASPI